MDASGSLHLIEPAGEDFLRAVIDMLPSEVVIRDADSRILFANVAFGGTYQRTPEQVIGRRDAELWAEFGRPPEQVAEWLAEDREILETGETKEYIQEIVRPSGQTVYFHNVKMLITLPDGRRCVLAMYTDVTVRKRVEDELRAADAHAAQLAGIQRAAATYAHEINNPLTGILGLAQVLLEEGADAAETREVLTEIKGAAERIRDVIRKLERLRDPKARPRLENAELLDLGEEE